MKFCPNCESRMKPRIEENILICPKCGFTEAKNEIKTIPLIEQSGASLKIIESEKGPSALPTTSIDCPKCGNNIAFWWMLQTRSADEATTQFYRCTQCSHTWRNYA
ncbi:MAG: transcription factor S [Nitrososphaeraceae archaeon]|nr:transcription factor S [Nitrososphaeraceae archaeon]MDW0169783.1 transcription factor S [Nitrososphaeraceae archaeon]MDW0171522.1 transcription factor S [Nitrososphaeraceae archaeon]MDW0174379.1 transcription factor S [Nitrososphaeraceae archaeon]MDW0176395.1 transcription factor S [Nitrososphaeraceae archaeon]